MLNTIHRAIHKTFKNDSTTIINNLLSEEASYEILTEDEKIIASLFTFLHAPLTISYGLLMTLIGLILAPIPGLVIKVKVREETFNADIYAGVKEGKKLMTSLADILNEPRGLSYSILTTFARFIFWPIPGSIVGMQSKQDTSNYSNVEIKTVELGCENPEEYQYPIPDKSNPPSSKNWNITPYFQYLNHKTVIADHFNHSPSFSAYNRVTITGYRLIINGINTIIAGVFEPLHGISNFFFFGGKKLVSLLKNTTQHDSRSSKKAWI